MALGSSQGIHVLSAKPFDLGDPLFRRTAQPVVQRRIGRALLVERRQAEDLIHSILL
jgi:hypothetical protein